MLDPLGVRRAHGRLEEPLTLPPGSERRGG